MSIHDEQIDDARITAYFEGACSPDECAEIDRWIHAVPERRILVARLRTLWESRKFPELAVYDRKALKENVLRAVRSVSASNEHARPSAHHKGRLASWMPNRSIPRFAFPSAFAVLALIAGAVLFSTQRMSRTSTAVQQYHTVAGQWSTVRFADGSLMTLGPVSHASVAPEGINISGEAYFEVAQHPNRPFVVNTRNARVSVLGTTFSVRQYSDELTSQVVVEDGKITVRPRQGRRANDAPIVVSARMLAQVTDSGVTVSSDIPTQDFTSWTHGTLVFRGVPLGELVGDLGRAYGADIRVADTTLAKHSIRMDISITEQPLREVLDLISDVAEAHYTKQGQTYVLSPGRMATQNAPTAPSRHPLPQLEHQYGR